LTLWLVGCRNRWNKGLFCRVATIYQNRLASHPPSIENQETDERHHIASAGRASFRKSG
jgi:hypothetical protein